VAIGITNEYARKREIVDSRERTKEGKKEMKDEDGQELYMCSMTSLLRNK
jgi:hypothetical protein